MECVNVGETYPSETITLGIDITGCTLIRDIKALGSGIIAKSWRSDNVGEITIDDAAAGEYTVPKWPVDIAAGNYAGEDRIIYANGDVQDLWDLSLKVSR